MDEEAMETETIPKEGGASPTSLHFTTSQQSGTQSPLQSQECSGGDTGETPYASLHSQQVSMAEYNQQAHHYTQQALRELKASSEYKKHTMKCHRCSLQPASCPHVANNMFYFLPTLAAVAVGMLGSSQQAAGNVVALQYAGRALCVGDAVRTCGTEMSNWYVHETGAGTGTTVSCWQGWGEGFTSHTHT